MEEIKEIDQVEAGKNKNLFRGRTIDGVWIEGYLHQAMDIENKVLHTMIMRNRTNVDVFDGKPFQASYIVDEKTVGQYTGCDDKNGKPIFEGDIVRIHGWWYASGPAGYEKDITTVRYCHDVCGFTPMCNYDCDCGVYHDADECEVIGNIYDNPELLEVADE